MLNVAVSMQTSIEPMLYCKSSENLRQRAPNNVDNPKEDCIWNWVNHWQLTLATPGEGRLALFTNLFCAALPL